MCDFDGSPSAEELLRRCKQGGPMQISSDDTTDSTLMSLQEGGLDRWQYQLIEKSKQKEYIIKNSENGPE